MNKHNKATLILAIAGIVSFTLITLRDQLALSEAQTNCLNIFGGAFALLTLIRLISLALND